MKKVVGKFKIKNIVVSILVLLSIFFVFRACRTVPKIKNTIEYKHYEEQDKLKSSVTLSSEIYSISNGYVTRILPETTLSDLKNNLDNQKIEVYDKNGNVVEDSQLIGTGMRLKSGEEEYKLAVVGDVTGDGKVGITDLVQMKLTTVGLMEKLVDEYQYAGDMNFNGSVTITDVTRVNLAVVNLIDIIAPNSFIPQVTSTKHTITVIGETTDTNSGMKEYWFELNRNGWVSNDDRISNRYTFSNLESNTEYTVRMKVIDKSDNIKITRRVKISTLNTENANISIVASTEEWTNQNIMVAVNYNSNIAEETKQISIDNGQTWQEYTEPIIVEKNIKIKARVVNKEGNILEEQEKEITNIDKLEPREFEVTGSSTTNSITITGGTVDRTQTSEYGRSEIKEYIYKIKRGDWEQQEVSTEITYTFTNLKQNAEYEITVTAVDNAGNTITQNNAPTIIRTKNIDEAGEIIITAEPNEEWTNEGVRIAVEYPETEYLRQISIDGGINWEEYVGEIFLKNNTKVLARLKDITGQTGTEEKYEVTNIDKLAPKQFEIIEEATTNNIQVKINVEDAETTQTDGKSGIKEYEYKINDGVTETTYAKIENTYTFENLVQGTDYTITVIVKDFAGNETGVQKVVRTKTIDGAGEIIITAEPKEEWTNQGVKITAEYPETGFINQISIDNGATWQNYEGEINLTNNTIVKARIQEATGQIGTEVTYEVTNIDKLSPNNFEITTTSTTNSITINASTTDAEATQTDGKSEIKEYEYTLRNGRWTENYKTQNTMYTFENLQQGTNYYITVTAIDNAGNRTQDQNLIKMVNTKSVNDIGEIEIIPSTTEWTNEAVTITVEYPETDYAKEISLDNGRFWKEYTGAEILTNNTTIRVRIKETTGQIGAENSYVIKNIDKLVPLDFEFETEITTNSITVKAITEDAEETAEDGKSGIKEYIYILGDGVNSTQYVGAENSYIFNNLIQDKEYTIQVIAKDNASNEKESKNANKTVNTPSVDEFIRQSGEIKIIPSTREWNNEHVSIEVVYPMIEGYTREISTNGGIDWEIYENAVVIETNACIKARMKDNNGQAGTEVEYQLTNIDKLSPNAFDISSSSTTNTITISLNGEVQDQNATLLYGKSGIKEYEYKIVNGRWSETYVTTDIQHSFENLIQGTDYYVTVTAYDNAGNKTQNNGGTKIICTDTLDSIGEIYILKSPNVEWTNMGVTVTVQYPDTEYEKEVSVNNGLTWQTYTGEIFITDNTTVRARVKDEIGQIGGEVTSEIVNIDKLTPKEFSINAEATTNSILIKANTDDKEKTISDGKSGIKEYTYIIKKENVAFKGVTTSDTYHTFENLQQGITYEIEVIAIDFAGNQTISNAYSITTKTVNQIINNEPIQIVPSTKEWTNKDITIEVIYPMADGYTRKISIDNGVTWQEYTRAVEISKNTIIQAKLEDQYGQTGLVETYEVNNIDKLTPNAFNISVNTTKNSLTVNGITTDKPATVEYATTGIERYKYVIKNNDWSITKESSNTSYMFTGLSQGKEYKVEVFAIDGAGNEISASNNGITKRTILLEAIQLLPNTKEFTNQDVEVTAIYPSDIDDLTKLISKDGEVTYQDYTNMNTKVIVTGNTEIVAKMEDNGTIVGEKARLLVTNIDKLKPNDFTPSVDSTTNSITISGTTQDAAQDSRNAQSGIKAYYFSIDDGNTWVTNSNTLVSSYTFNNLPQSTTYNIKMKAVDKAGNERITATVTGTTKTLPSGVGNITFDTENWLNYKASNVINTTTSYTIQYKVNNGEWQIGTIATNLNHNDTLYARLSDGINVGSETNKVIKDTKIPTVEVKQISKTTNTITVQVNAQDFEWGMSTTPTYNYYISTNGSSYTLKSTTTARTYEYTGLNPGTVYYIKVETSDKAGNTGVGTTSIQTTPVYILTIDADGGTYTGANPITQEAGTIITVNNPTKDGYTFAGWTLSGSGSISGSRFTFGNGNTQLKANWTPIEYYISYNGNGNTSGSMSNSTHYYGIPKTLSNNGYSKSYKVTYNTNGGNTISPDTVSYTFAGWAKTSNGSVVYSNQESVSNLTTINGETITLYARWNSASVRLPTPTRNGYIFDGWYTSGGTQISGTTYTPTSNITLEAKWSQIKYYISYNGNGHTSGSMSNSTHYYGIPKTLSNNGYVKSYKVTYNTNGGNTISPDTVNYTFAGWAKTSNGSVVYLNQENVSNLTTTNGETITLYARWNSTSVTLPTPTKTGYKFDGWYTDSGLTNKVDGTTYTPTTNTTLYAKWTKNKYIVTYNTNGGTLDSETVEVTVGTSTILPLPTKSGAEFTGWYTTSALITLVGNAGDSYTPTSSVTLHAGWSTKLEPMYIYNRGVACEGGFITASVTQASNYLLLEGGIIITNKAIPQGYKWVEIVYEKYRTGDYTWGVPGFHVGYKTRASLDAGGNYNYDYESDYTTTNGEKTINVNIHSAAGAPYFTIHVLHPSTTLKIHSIKVY